MFDINNATPQELEMHHHEVARRLEQLRDQELKDVTERASRIGFALVPIGRVQKKRGRKPLGAKYSDDNGNEWCGRGRKPAWLQAKLDQGAHLEDFAV